MRHPHPQGPPDVRAGSAQLHLTKNTAAAHRRGWTGPHDHHILPPHPPLDITACSLPGPRTPSALPGLCVTAPGSQGPGWPPAASGGSTSSWNHLPPGSLAGRLPGRPRGGTPSPAASRRPDTDGAPSPLPGQGWPLWSLGTKNEYLPHDHQHRRLPLTGPPLAASLLPLACFLFL